MNERVGPLSRGDAGQQVRVYSGRGVPVRRDDRRDSAASGLIIEDVIARPALDRYGAAAVRAGGDDVVVAGTCRHVEEHFGHRDGVGEWSRDHLLHVGERVGAFAGRGAGAEVVAHDDRTRGEREVDRVVVAAVAGRTEPGAAINDVVAGSGQEMILVTQAAQRVVAGAAGDIVLAVVARDRVVPGAAIDPDEAGDNVVEARSDDAADDEERVGAVARRRRERARRADRARRGAVVDRVVTAPAAAALDVVVARPAGQDVVAEPRVERVVAVAAVDGVVAVAAADRVVSTESIDDIVATEGVDHVVTGGAIDDLAGGRTFDCGDEAKARGGGGDGRRGHALRREYQARGGGNEDEQRREPHGEPSGHGRTHGTERCENMPT